MSWDADLSALIADLRSRLVGALECAEACLHFATVADERTTGYTFNSALHRRLDVKGDIDSAVPLAGQSAVKPDALGRIADALSRSSDAPLAAWYAADRIGRLISRDYSAHVFDKQGRTDYALTDLAPFPTPPDACTALYGKQRFSERAGIDRHPYEPFIATGLALWREGMHGNFRVQIDTVGGEAFNAALEEGGGLRIGLIQPNSKFSDLHPGVYTEPSEPDSRFFGIRPLDPDKQQQVIIEAVDAAEAQDVGIVLLPELVTTEENAQAFGSSIESRGPKLQVVVGGSYHHVDASGLRRNSTRVHFVNRINGRRPKDRIYSKSGPFYVDLTSKSGNGDAKSTETDEGSRTIEAAAAEPDLKFREDVEPSFEVRLYVGEAITVVVVICADLFNGTLRQLLSVLGPSLVLVCNMTYKTEGFVDIAHELVAASQSTSVMVNNPGFWPRTAPDHVVVGMPLETGRVLRDQFRYGEHVLVFDSRPRSIRRPFLGRSK